MSKAAYSPILCSAPIKVAVLTVATAALAVVFLSVGASAQIVQIPDFELELSIRDELGIFESDITAADMAELIELNFPHRNISNLEGLEAAVNLESLNLENNLIDDLAPLAGLTKLRTLELSENMITRLDPLGGLTALERLCLEENKIGDVGGLANLASLRILNLDHNRIGSLEGLESLDQLFSLCIASNEVGDLTPISSLPALTELDASANRISDVSPLASSPQLRSLDLPDNLLTGLTGLTSITTLNSLDVRRNFIDFDPALQPWADRQTLSAAGVIVRFDSQKRIEEITIEDAELRSELFTQLGKDPSVDNLTNYDLAEVYALGVRDRFVASLEGLEHAINLVNLDLHGNSLTDFSALSNLVRLRVLDIGLNTKVDLSRLAPLGELEELNASGCDTLVNVVSLAGLPKLEVLSLDGNDIGDISALSGLTRLRRLVLDRNQLGDISALADLTSLNSVSLSDNLIPDISAMLDLPELTSVFVSQNFLDLSPGSADRVVIDTLEARGVSVTYEPQKLPLAPALTITFDAGSQSITLNWQSQPGLVYQVRSSGDLSAWSVAGLPSFAGSGERIEAILSLPDAGRGYFDVLVTAE